MPVKEITPGIKFQQTIEVTDKIIVPAMSDFFSGFAEMPRVFATAYLVGFAEWTCVEALKPYLSDGERTVGISVDMTHSAATPVGMKVTAEVEIIEVNGKKLKFKVECHDEKEIISQSFHERYIIDLEKFMERVENKLL